MEPYHYGTERLVIGSGRVGFWRQNLGLTEFSSVSLATEADAGTAEQLAGGDHDWAVLGTRACAC